MIKLKEILDPIGWAISKAGNKTRCKKSFYIQRKLDYVSPFFNREVDATKWFNDYILKRRPPSTFTLYEILEDIRSQELEAYKEPMMDVLQKALHDKQITQQEIDHFIEPVLQARGEGSRQEFYNILAKYQIKIVKGPVKTFETTYSGGYTKCTKCGHEELSTGLDYNKETGEKSWYHRCTKCQHKMPIDTKKDLKKEMSMTSGIAGYNAPSGIGGPVVDISGMRLPGKKKKLKFRRRRK